MGRWSRRLAREFVAWLRVPAGAHWLDVGCGTGALVQAICRDADPASVVGCDPAEPFIEHARAHAQHDRATYVVAGIGALPSRDGGFDDVVSSLALNFFPDPSAAVDEMRSRAAPHATIAACVWDYGGEMQMLRWFWDAARAVDAGAHAIDEGARFPLCRQAALVDLFTARGLTDVRCEPIEIATVFADFADYWQPFLGGTGPAPAYLASLGDERRAALETAVRSTLPCDADGTIVASARAWAVRGTSS